MTTRLQNPDEAPDLTPKFAVGDLVRHRASRRPAVVLQVLPGETGNRYEVELDFFSPTGAAGENCCIVPELVLERVSS